jgi:hypothetical protein
MNTLHDIPLPSHDTDIEGARRVFEEFGGLYQPVLQSAEKHLHMMITNMEPEFAAAYTPWHSALYELSMGIYMMSRNIPIPDMQRFIDVLHMFCFESAVQFLRDLCRNAKISLPRNWEAGFRSHIDMLLFAVAIINGELVTVE